MNKAVVTCALTGLLTDPSKYPVPVSPSEMATSARQAVDAGASTLHLHFRQQEPGMGHLPTWDPEVVAEIVDAIVAACPDVVLNFSTGVMGSDISGPLACLDRCRPDMAALNAGSLNYLKVRRDGSWAWPPLLFDNPVEKIQGFVEPMKEWGIVPECECFDTGIVRSLSLFRQVGLLDAPIHASLVMGVASGMPAKADWLPLLIEELPAGSHWQAIVIGRQDVWDVHGRAAELGGNLRTGLEDTFYLPDGSKAQNNGALIEALVSLARSRGREIASPSEARDMLRA